MIRRKNSEYATADPRYQHSPIRFQRQNVNLSPGLSPMRSRTPVRKNRNVSPLRVAQFEANPRAPSPIKFVRSIKPSKREDDTCHNHILQQNQNFLYHNKAQSQLHNRKRVESKCVEQGEHSYTSNYTENVDRNGVNTKLFSKLVSKLNSDKKKDSSCNKIETRPIVPLKKIFSEAEQHKKQFFNGVKNVQSIENPPIKSKTGADAVPVTAAQFSGKPSLKSEKQPEKPFEKLEKIGELKSDQQNAQPSKKQSKNKDQIDCGSKSNRYEEQESDFDCIRICLQKLQTKTDHSSKESVYREPNSVNFSFNMDPFI